MQQRQNSGYTSVGHLLAHKDTLEVNETLKKFLKSMCEDSIMKDLISHSEAFWKWDEYIKSQLNMNMHTFAAFLDGMIRKPGTDPLLMQLRVELVAWKSLKSSLLKNYQSSKNFKLFAIFNRFCRVEDLPLEIGPHESNYLCYTLNTARDKTVRKFLNLEQFLNLLQNVDAKTLDKYYDGVVHDLVISDEVQARVYHKK